MGSKTLNLSQVPVPDVIEQVDIENQFNLLKAKFLSTAPELSDALTLESDPASILLRTMAYQISLDKQAINDAVQANMLASATGFDLDAIAARYNVTRKPESAESDDEFRQRVQLSFDALNTAGSQEAYVFHALSADASIKDAYVESPEPCEINITLLSHDNDGQTSNSVLNKVRTMFDAIPNEDTGSTPLSKIRPMGDRVSVYCADIIHYQVKASLKVLPGPSIEKIQTHAVQAVSDYCDGRHFLGKKVSLAGILAALHVPGVDEVELIQPSSDISALPQQAAKCAGFEVDVEYLNE